MMMRMARRERGMLCERNCFNSVYMFPLQEQLKLNFVSTKKKKSDFLLYLIDHSRGSRV